MYVVARGLVGGQFDADMVMHEAFPQVHDIAMIDECDGRFVAAAGGHSRYQIAEVAKNVVFLNVPIGDPLRHHLVVYFRYDPDGTGDDGRPGLCTRHTAEARGEVNAPPEVVTEAHFAASIEQRDSRTMHDALRPDVHERACGHLPVLRHAEGVEAVPVFFFGVIWDHHTVRDDHPWRVGVRWK